MAKSLQQDLQGELNRVSEWFSRQGRAARAGVITAVMVSASLVALGIADLTRWDVPDKIADDRQIALLMVVETVLLALVFFLVDAAADRRNLRQWERTAGPVIASLRLNMQLTQQRMDHAIRHPDDDVAWQALAKSTAWFLSYVQANQGLLAVHSDLVGLAPRFSNIAMRLADRGGGLAEWTGIRRVVDDPGVQKQSELLRDAVKQLADDTFRFEEQSTP